LVGAAGVPPSAIGLASVASVVCMRDMVVTLI
jgi:hypothetical protein